MTGKIFIRLGFLGMLLLTILGIDRQSPSVSAQSKPGIVIAYRDDGFSVESLEVLVGTTITWHNQTESTLQIRGAVDEAKHVVFLPMVQGDDTGSSADALSVNGDVVSISTSSLSAKPGLGFEVTIPPGGQYSHQVKTIGRFNFFDLQATNFRGEIIILPINRIYAGSDGSALYLRSEDDQVYGFGEHPGTNEPFAYALSGNMANAQITATYWDVPKGERQNQGEVVLDVINGGTSLALVSDTGDPIGSTSWVEVAPNSFPWPIMQPAGFQATSVNDLTGAFMGDDGSRHYFRQVGNDVVWVAEAAAPINGRPPWVTVFVGQVDISDAILFFDVSGHFADVPKGLETAAGTFGNIILADRTQALFQGPLNRTADLEPDYEVDWDVFEQAIVDALDGKTVGYAYAIGEGLGLRRSGAGGSRLLPSNGVANPIPFTEDTYGQMLSTSKTVTAVALIRALEDRNLTVDDLVAPHLPDCWDDDDGIETLRFRELLDHTSMLTNPSSDTTVAPDVPYNMLKQLIADGRTGEVEYNNAAYALMRYLVPFLADEPQADAIFAAYDCNEDGQEINEALSWLFQDYLFDMLDLVDVEATFWPTQPDPSVVDVAYLYNRNFPHYQGVPPNEQGWFRAGAGYLSTSVLEYRRFLAALDTGELLPDDIVEQMYDGDLGFDSPADGIAGPYYTKNGGAGGDCSQIGRAQAMIYPSHINAYILINSAIDRTSLAWFYDYNHNGAPSNETQSGWGIPGDIPIAGDFDRDGRVDDVAVFRPSNQTWYYDYNHDGGPTSDEQVTWGRAGDIPFAGDFDGDGEVDDVGVFRPSNQTWYYDYNHDGGPTSDEHHTWGQAGDIPIAGDFDSDGESDDVGVFRPSNRTWYYDYNHDGGTSSDEQHTWGKSCDLPIVGDFDSDGEADDVAMYRPSTGRWYYDYNHNGTKDDEVAGWGGDFDVPLAGDFDSGGIRDDVALVRAYTGDLVSILEDAFDSALK